MARLTREQSQALTRENILNGAADVLAQYGYEGASVERIAESAGYSKGAFYSNFSSKDDLLRQLLKGYAAGVVEDFAQALEGAEDVNSTIEAVVRWCDERAGERKWGLIVIDFMRRSYYDDSLTDAQRQTFISQWREVGGLLSARLFPDSESPIIDEELGGIIMDMTYGGISVYLESAASTGQMIRSILQSLVLQAKAPCAT